MRSIMVPFLPPYFINTKLFESTLCSAKSQGEKKKNSIKLVRTEVCSIGSAIYPTITRSMVDMVQPHEFNQSNDENWIT